ncbi:MAG: hypothetical protein ACFFBD_13315, partial [Candidatus Hodarchaeota archaeon]
MKEGKFKRIARSFCRKNIFLTSLAFFIGLTLQLTDTTLILLVIVTATVSTWWYWRPPSVNAESKLILDTLKNYPAVVIKNHAHSVAFNSTPPCLAAAYKSPIPDILLRRYLTKRAPLVEGVELSVSRSGLDAFLLVKSPLSPHTSIKNMFKTFQSIIDLLELHFQAQFQPAERYQTLQLFGLEKYLSQADQPVSPQASPLRSPPVSLLPPSQKSSRNPQLIEPQVQSKPLASPHSASSLHSKKVKRIPVLID